MLKSGPRYPAEAGLKPEERPRRTREKNFAGRVLKIVCAISAPVFARAHATPAEQFLRDRMHI